MSTTTITPPAPGTGHDDGTTVPLRRRQPFGRWFADKGWRHIVGILAAVFSVFPLLYVLSAALNPAGTMAGASSLFTQFGWGNFEALFANQERPFGRWFANTLLIGLVTSALTVFLGAMAAYAFSRMRFAGRRVGLLTLLLLQMFPQLLTVVAIDRCGIRHVGLHAQQACGDLSAAVGDGHLVAVGFEGPGNGQANPPVAAGDRSLVAA